MLALLLLYVLFTWLLDVIEWCGGARMPVVRHVVASTLIGFWVLVAFIIPILGDLAINKAVHSPKGGDIVLTQRELLMVRGIFQSK